jgi:subtilisin family serine protease
MSRSGIRSPDSVSVNQFEFIIHLLEVLGDCIMQGSFWGTVSAKKRLALVFSFLLVLTLIVVAALPSSSSATQQESGPEVKQKRARPPFVPGEVLVRYKSEKAAVRQTRETMLNADSGQLSVRIERFVPADVVPGLRLARVAAEDTMAALVALRKQPDVLYAEPNYLWYRPTAVPNDPCFPINALPGCQNQDLYGLAKIGAPLAWDTIKGSRDTALAGFGTPRIIVAVDDEGIDATHPDLIGNIWTNPAEIAANGVDDDNNGFIDDIHGYDFFNDDGSIEAANHATHVAGTIGATGNNGIGVVGVNWQVGLMSLKHLQGDNGSTADAVRAAAYAKLMRDRWISTSGAQGANVRVINSSWGPNRVTGNGFSLALRDAITAVGQSGILYVTSAGNDAVDNDIDPGYPASYDLPNLISVAATDRPDALAGFSDFGVSTITMGAPGTGILSTTTGNTYSIMSGTSMAAPHVSGAAALLLAANPNLTFQKLKGLLIFNGDLLPSLTGKTLTGRRLNVGSSMTELSLNDVTLPGTVTNFHLNSQNGRSLNVGWTASGDNGAAGTASLYKLSFTDSDNGAVIFLKSVVPLASGVTQAVDVKLPYRHLNGTLTLQEFDNSGNEGVPATFAVSVSPPVGDPYLVSEGSAVALSTGGTPLLTNCDDCFKTQALPFSFPFFGENFNSVKIGSNGAVYLTPPEPLSNDSQSSAVLLKQFKMIAGLWMDLRTDRAGKDVFVVTPDASRIIFRWAAVTFDVSQNPALEFPVNFEIELRSNGTILTRYGAGNTHLDPVVGISAGEPDTYLVASHTSEDAETNLTNAPEVTFLPRSIGIGNTVRFSAEQYTVGESGFSATLVVVRSGNTTTQSSVDYVTTNGSATQKGDFIFGTGRVNFGAGETIKTISILIIDDTFQEGFESFSVQMSNPVNTVLGAQNVSAVQITDNDFAPPTTNPLDNSDAAFFVRQHYLDFLNREPDAAGFAFWKNQITSCGADTQCVQIRRINVSAAFFLSIENQETGYLVYRIYKAAYGNLTVPAGAPVPVRYEEYLPDSQRIASGVMVGIGDWQAQLESNKAAFAQDFVLRSRFTTAYPPGATTPDQFVDALYANAGVTPAAAERTSVIGEFGGAPTSANTAARGRALRRVAENTALVQQEKNKAFVLAQYFGYLRRNPYDPPESTLDYGGYNFWLGKLNQFNGNFVNADMVKAFLDSGEYRHRFGP